MNAGPSFNKVYLVDTLKILGSASQQSLARVEESQDPDLYGYLQELRETVVEVYTTLIQGLTEDHDSI